jgi:small subunit ribosomal protein S16
MAIRLRFALHGTRHKRVFHLVAIHNGRRRDAKPAETLGIYDPHMTNGQTHKTIEWSVDRIRYWLYVGAVPSKPVSKLLEMVSSFSLHGQTR